MDFVIFMGSYQEPTNDWHLREYRVNPNTVIAITDCGTHTIHGPTGTFTGPITALVFGREELLYVNGTVSSVEARLRGRS